MDARKRAGWLFHTAFEEVLVVPKWALRADDHADVLPRIFGRGAVDDWLADPVRRPTALAMHGAIFARCAREFEGDDLHLLTVHHKDGNHDNNPRDGSNWENLCVYCHEAEHSTGLLGDYLTGRDRKRDGG